MQNRSRHGFVEAVLRRPAVILAIAATCRKTERMENVGTIFYTAPVAPHVLINAFFLYSFLGWVMECIVIRREKGRWENRGFAHLPFCIIYGFGAMLGFALLRPFSGNYVLLYLVGAVLATLFEYLTARLMLRLFGTFWWDYTNKPFNYKGILCLESTLGWGSSLFCCLHFCIGWCSALSCSFRTVSVWRPHFCWCVPMRWILPSARIRRIRMRILPQRPSPCPAAPPAEKRGADLHTKGIF